MNFPLRTSPCLSIVCPPEWQSTRLHGDTCSPSSSPMCFRRLFASLCRCSGQSLGLSNSSLSGSASVFYLFLSIPPLCFLSIALLQQRCPPVLYSAVLSTGTLAIGRQWECSYLLCINYFEQWQLTLCNTNPQLVIGVTSNDPNDRRN